MKKNLLLLLMLILASNTYAQFGETVIKSITHNGIKRDYRVYIPSSYVAGKAAPLVVNMHGYGSDDVQQEYYGEFRPFADAEGFLVVHPKGTAAPGIGTLFFNVGFFASPIDDTGFINAMIDEISKEYAVNQKKIYATGMSNGGFMSYELACTTTNRFAAIASVTGAITKLNFPKCKNAAPIPVMQIHGTADATVPYLGNAQFLAIDTIVNFWVKKNDCNPIAVKTAVPDINITDGATAERFVYSGGKNGTTVELWKVQNGAHSWPGAFVNLGVTCQDFNASKEVWRFFKQYSLITPTNEVDALPLTIFPNPSADILNIELPDAVSDYKLEIYDNQGKTYINNNHFNAAQITIDHLPTGIFFIKVSNENGVATKRFVKM